VTDITSVIQGQDLQPGDAINIPGDHTAMFVSWIVPGSSAQLYEEPGCSGSITYAHAFTSNLQISGSQVYSSYHRQTFTAIRYNSLVLGPAPPAAPTVTAPVSSAPSCTYKTHSGICTSSCSGGSFRSTRQGANGCQAFASTVLCCISADMLVDDTSSGWLISSAAFPLGAIVGVAVGGLLVIALVVVGIVVYVRLFRRRAPADQGAAIQFQVMFFADLCVLTLRT
jgi:hypothetical protein